MKCKKCGSRRISWEIDSASVVTTYDEAGNQIDLDFKCDSLNCPKCAECGSVDLEREHKMVRLETKARIILTVPEPAEMVGTSEEVNAKIMLAAEQYINSEADCFTMPGTEEVKVGVRVHIEDLVVKTKRFWIDDKPELTPFGKDTCGIVDEEAGGIVVYANSLICAQKLRRVLERSIK